MIDKSFTRGRSELTGPHQVFLGFTPLTCALTATSLGWVGMKVALRIRIKDCSHRYGTSG